MDSVRDSAGLTSAQHRAIEMILEGEHYIAIAKELDVHVDTLRKWRLNKNFKKELSKQRRQAAKAAQEVMATNATYAAQRIIEIADDPDATATQLKAAIKVFDSAVGATIEEFEDRINKLEEAITKAV